MAARPEARLAGTTLVGRYDILDLIGAGGMGAVYRARDRELDELVALKAIRAELASSPDMIARFRHEVKIARRVTHANVARTFELGQADGLMFFTMELVEGESLTRRLRRLGRMSMTDAAALVCSVCDGLAAAHAAGVIHRDIKPDNVLIASDGRVVVADFGVASIGAVAGEVAGTLAYMAPEQARGEPPSPAADIYAVGVMLVEMVTGAPATTRTSLPTSAGSQRPSARIANVDTTGLDPDFVDVIACATAAEIANRIGSAAELRARLSKWASPQPAVRPAESRSPTATELRTVIILAPVGDAARLYLAEAVRDLVLARLTRQTRWRVLPRVERVHSPGATVIDLRSSDALEVTVSPAEPDRSAVTLRLPLVAELIEEAADAIVNAVTTSVVFDREPTRNPSTEALDLLLHARHIGEQDAALLGSAIEHLERANQLLPNDPRIAASLAIAQVRQAFFATEETAALLARATHFVHAALATGPHLAEARLAAGHLELNVGEARSAAAHYRIAIACAPHLAEAHESLGRMLLEAGFIDAGCARLDEALAMAPGHKAIRWDIARAFALEQRWADHDRVMADLAAREFHRPTRSGPLRMRFAIWRGDLAEVAAIRSEPAAFDPVLIESSLAVYLDGAWQAHRDALVRRATDSSSTIRRRRAFVAQFVAEVAGFARDASTCLAMIERAVDHGLFDLHWVDRCPLLDFLRGTPELANVRARVKQRADAILDALYGDHGTALSDTVLQ